MIPAVTNLKELRESNDILGTRGAMQQRMAEDGYLFFRQLQDTEMLWELRRPVSYTHLTLPTIYSV